MNDDLDYCINCQTELLNCDDDPNGDHNCVCARCRAEEEHNFDVEPNVKFTRDGCAIYPEERANNE